VITASGTYTENLNISVSVALLGAGQAKTIVDGSQKGPTASISNNAAVSITGMTLRNGKNYNCGGGIVNSGQLLLAYSTVTGNTAKGTDITPGQGGGVCNYGLLTVSTSTVSNNTATEAGGVFNLGSVYLWRSTLSGNSTGSFGGGAESFGPMNLVDSTVANNSSIFGPGIYNVGALAVNSSTISANSSSVGAPGGIDNSSQEGNTVTLANTILAGNANSDCNGVIASQDYNLVGSTSGCEFTAAPHDLVNVSAGIGSLASNGGPTQTMALLPGSPAIDAGNPQGCRTPNGTLIPVDQRGFPRSRPMDPVCDIGAYELKQ
jgi:hypothetical protein